MQATKSITASLLEPQCIDVLNWVAPDWQTTSLQSELDGVGHIWQALSACQVTTLGDLTTLTPLTLLALAAKAANPPPAGALFWPHLCACLREYINPLLAPILVELITQSLTQPPSQPESTSPPDTGYSSLLIQPEEVISQVFEPDSITIIRWLFADTRPVAFAAGEIRATPLLAAPVRDALREVGCDLNVLSLHDLPLAIRTLNALLHAGERSLEAVVSQTPQRLFTSRNFGPRAYEDLAEALRSYLAPWLVQLPSDTLVPTERLHPFLAAPAEEEQTTPAQSASQQVPKRETSALYFSVESILQGPGREPGEQGLPLPSGEAVKTRLLDLLDSCEIAWRQLSVLETCPDLKWTSISASLNDLTLGELIESEQTSLAAQTTSLESANQLTGIIQQALTDRLVTHLLQAATPAQEEARHVLADLTVEALFAELIDSYINFLPESTGARKKALPREMKVLLARSGVLDGQPRTLEEMAALLDLTRERIRQLEKRAEDFLQGMSLRRFTGGLATLARWAIQAEGGITTGAQAEQRISIWLPFGSLYPEMTTRLLIRWADDVTLLNGGWLLISPLNLRLGRIGGAWDSFFRCRCLNTAA